MPSTSAHICCAHTLLTPFPFRTPVVRSRPSQLNLLYNISVVFTTYRTLEGSTPSQIHDSFRLSSNSYYTPLLHSFMSSMPYVQFYADSRARDSNLDPFESFPPLTDPVKFFPSQQFVLNALIPVHLLGHPRLHPQLRQGFHRSYNFRYLSHLQTLHLCPDV